MFDGLGSKRVGSMKLIKFTYRYDFGHDTYIQFLIVKGWCLFQFSLSWNDYGGFPYLQITSGNNGLFGFMFWVYKFGLDFDILSRTWNFDYLETLKDED